MFGQGAQSSQGIGGSNGRFRRTDNQGYNRFVLIQQLTDDTGSDHGTGATGKGEDHDVEIADRHFRHDSRDTWRNYLSQSHAFFTGTVNIIKDVQIHLFTITEVTDFSCVRETGIDDITTSISLTYQVIGTTHIRHHQVSTAAATANQCQFLLAHCHFLFQLVGVVSKVLLIKKPKL